MSAASRTWPYRRVLVLGLAATGRAVTRALLAAGVGVVAADRRDDEDLRARADELASAGADVLLGSDGRDALARVQAVVPSPGVAPTGPALAAALDAGMPVLSEPEVAWHLANDRTRFVAVTGTNGKTSTTELLASCLDAPAAGNIGVPLVELVTQQAPPLAVVELSSFQLRFCDRFRADVGVLLNVAPDHLDWHGTYDDYAGAKARVWANQRPSGAPGRQGADWAVVNADDEGARQILRVHPPPGRLVTFTVGRPERRQVGVAGGWIVERVTRDAPTAVVAVDRLRARGGHNLANALAAAAAALTAGRPRADLGDRLAAFVPGAHRLEAVATLDGVTWVDDSKATNPHAAAAALASFERVVWIAGGLNKGLGFDDLAEPIRRHVRVAVTIGSSGAEIAALTRRLGVITVEAGQMDAAVDAAARLATPGDTVLLAPACASMDQFRDYAERGDTFQQLVAALEPGEVAGGG